MHDWPQIHERYGPLVWQTVYRILGNHTEAQDCFQDVFAEVLERSSFRSVRDWPAFLRWMAVRRVLDRLRKRRADAKRVAADGDIATLPASRLAPMLGHNGTSSSNAFGTSWYGCRCSRPRPSGCSASKK